jgi:hypothetical protein
LPAASTVAKATLLLALLANGLATVQASIHEGEVWVVGPLELLATILALVLVVHALPLVSAHLRVHDKVITILTLGSKLTGLQVAGHLLLALELHQAVLATEDLDLDRSGGATLNGDALVLGKLLLLIHHFFDLVRGLLGHHAHDEGSCGVEIEHELRADGLPSLGAVGAMGGVSRPLVDALLTGDCSAGGTVVDLVDLSQAKRALEVKLPLDNALKDDRIKEGHLNRLDNQWARAAPAGGARSLHFNNIKGHCWNILLLLLLCCCYGGGGFG